VFARAPTVEFACTGNTSDACFEANGVHGGPAAEAVVADLGTVPGLKVAMGWGPESQYVADVGAVGMYVHASDMAHDYAPISNVAAHAGVPRRSGTPPPPPPPPPSKTTQGVPPRSKHQVAFLMSDGDNLQWMYNAFARQATWWGSPDRGSVPLGWTVSPALHELGPVILDYLADTKTSNDDIVGAPSGVGYIYPSTWPAGPMADFATLTGRSLSATAKAYGSAVSAVNVIGDPCKGGVYVNHCPGLQAPNVTSLAPLLARPEIDGVFWYTFGAGYSGWHDTLWDSATKKPIIGARLSLWGEGKTGTMLGVKPMVTELSAQLLTGKISRSSTSANGYSLIPVHAWSHNVTDVRAVAEALEATGFFEIVTPSTLLANVRGNVKPPSVRESFPSEDVKDISLPSCTCSDPALCKPVWAARTPQQTVYTFHLGSSNDWPQYDWGIIDTICIFGEVDPALVCHAHAHGAYVTIGSGGITSVPNWHNTTSVDAWVAQTVARVVNNSIDGFNIDIEIPASAADASALTALSAKAAVAMKAAKPWAHVTFDVPSNGLVQQGCGKQYGRDYDYAGLAKALDFLVVMDYDSNAPQPNGVMYFDGGRRYPYATRDQAEAGCNSAGFPRLCTKAELVGAARCAAGWCSDWCGYWEGSDPVPGCGHPGFNNWTGNAGAYCCGKTSGPVPDMLLRERGPSCGGGRRQVLRVARGASEQAGTRHALVCKTLRVYPWRNGGGRGVPCGVRGVHWAPSGGSTIGQYKGNKSLAGQFFDSALSVYQRYHRLVVPRRLRRQPVSPRQVRHGQEAWRQPCRHVDSEFD